MKSRISWSILLFAACSDAQSVAPDAEVVDASVDTAGCREPRLQCPLGCIDPYSDAENCGGCGHSCRGRTCNDGYCDPEILVTNQPRPTHLAVDDTNVYWSNGGSSPNVVKLDKTTPGAVPVILAASPEAPTALALDATSVYWTSASTLTSVPITGGGPIVLQDQQTNASSLAVSNRFVYWSTEGAAGTPGSIMRRSLDTGAVDQLASSDHDPRFVCVSRGLVIYGEVMGGDVRAAGMVNPISSQVGFLGALACDDQRIFWALSGTIWMNSETVPAFAIASANTSNVVSDGEYLYYSYDNLAPSDLWQVRIDHSATAFPLARGVRNPVGIAVDRLYLYWIEDGSGSVFRVPLWGR